MTPNYSYLNTGSWSYDVLYPDGSGSYGNYIGQTLIDAEALTVQSAVTENYPFRKKYTLPFNGYQKRFDSWRDSRASLEQFFTGNGNTYKYHGVTLGVLGISIFSYFSSVTVPDPTQKVVSKLQNEISLGKSDLLTSLAEAHKTAEMVATTATRIYKALKALKRADIAGFSNALGVTSSRREAKRWRQRSRLAGLTPPPFVWSKHPVTGKRYRYYPKAVVNETKLKDFMAQTWLEYTYGWKPLLQDVYNAAQASASIGIEMSNAVRSVRARSSESVEFKDKYQQSQFAVDVYCSRTVYLEMGLNFRIEDGGPTFHTAFGLDNPATMLWEVIPFSFVADWFLPVGKAIASLSAYNGLTFVSGWKSSRQVWNCTVNAGPGAPWATGGGVWHVKSYKGQFYQKIVIINRSLVYEFPQYGFPQFKNPLSVSHMTSAISLLQTFFKK